MIKDIKPNQQITSFFVLDFFQLKQSKYSDYYLLLHLLDKTGSIKGFVWNNPLSVIGKLNEKYFVKIRGLTRTLGDSTIIDISDINPATREEIDLRDFFEIVKEGIDYWYWKLFDVVSLIENDYCNKLISQFINDDQFMISFKTRPAGASLHHNYIGGLLEHTVNTMALSATLADKYPETLNKDLLITGAFLHDLGKVEELNYETTIKYTTQGELLGHIALGMIMLEKKINQIKNFPYELALNLKHIVLSHHGKVEYGSPIPPKTPEAIALSILEGTDAKINHLNKVLKSKGEKTELSTFQRILNFEELKELSLKT